MPAIEVQDIWKRYNVGLVPSLWSWVPGVGSRRGGGKAASEAGDFWALKGIDFTVEQGSALGVIGRNGAGKTTLLSVLCGVTQATRGRVSVRGRVAPLIALGAGFQPELTGRENIYLNAVIMGMSRAEVKRKFDSILDFAELEQFIDTPVKKYSSGMVVRLGFAVAAHLEPDVLLVDEVLSVGDVAFQSKCLDQIRELRREGVTLVLVSHNMTLVESAVDRCLLLDHGTPLLLGDPQEAIAWYNLGAKPTETQ
ncbi:MAG: ABC transporter ATP-binding protein, partial [Dehalococcoidia bacterium]